MIGTNPWFMSRKRGGITAVLKHGLNLSGGMKLSETCAVNIIAINKKFYFYFSWPDDKEICLRCHKYAR